jgi:hypothetical protein
MTSTKPSNQYLPHPGALSPSCDLSEKEVRAAASVTATMNDCTGSILTPEFIYDALNRFPFDEAIHLSKTARQLLPRGRSLLYHGTPCPIKILRENVLWSANVGTFAVSFTRLLHVAIYWAKVPRDDDEKVGAIFVLDRDRLVHNFKLEPFRDPFWDDCPARCSRKASEAEEQVYGRNVVGLNRFLADVIWVLPDGTLRSTRARRAERLSGRALVTVAARQI